MRDVLVKGSAITSRERWVREHHGPTGERRLREALEPEHRALLDAGVLRSAWVPYSLLIDLSVTADRLFGEGDLAICRQMGAFGAKVNLPTLYRIFFRVGSLPFILKRAARMWEVHYSSGRLSVTDGPGWVRLLVEDFEDPHPALWEGVTGWGEATARLTGIGDARGAIERCPSTRSEGPAHIVIRWTP